MDTIMGAIVTPKTQVYMTIATLITVLGAMVFFGRTLGSMETSFEYMKSDIQEIKENQISMDQVMLFVEMNYEKKN